MTSPNTKMDFMSWKATPEGQNIFNGMKVLYSVETIKAEIEKMIVWHITCHPDKFNRTPRGWRMFVKHWFNTKPEIDKKRPAPITASQEQDHYERHKRSDGDKVPSEIGDILKEIVK